MCGLYALKGAPPTPATISGEVALWGRIWEHQNGYRAQYAYPIRLVVRVETPLETRLSVLLAVRLAEAYGVPVEVSSFGVDVALADHDPPPKDQAPIG